MKSCEGFDIVELGPGDPSKISLLLDATGEKESLHYLPMDISESAIRSLANELVGNYPHLLVDACVLDFTSQFGLIQRKRPALICFFGSTIGNFSRDSALDFVRKIARDMKQADRLLIGMDLIKDEEILHAAYNDSQGVTAAFNLNILSSVNNILESNFRK
jgi:L-histidine N-alpha-methyltransferase